MSAPGTQPRAQDSRAPRASRGAASGFSRLRGALGLVAVAGAILLIAAEFAAIYEIKVVTVVVDSVTGYDRHGVALALLGLAALPMALGAARRASRPAMLALAAIGAAALFIAIALDVPDVHETGRYGVRYDEAAAEPAAGLYLESLGGALLVVSGGGMLLLGGAPPGGSRRRG